MKKRIASIDILRAIAIIGMIMCANIGFNSGLPAWMFHAQTPPPTYSFDPSVAGLTWVDLVFPFFLLPMGAAFPLAMRKKLENGAGMSGMFVSLFKRWAILTLFALVIGNSSYNIWSTSREAWQVYLFLIAVWGGMFLSLVQARKKIVNIAGIILLAALACILVFWFGIPLDKGTSDIIIMILANVALWGGAIWMLTRNNLRLRWLVILFIAMVKAVDSYAPQVLDFIPDCGCMNWLFSFEWLQYLIIALSGSVVGDMILDHSRSGKEIRLDSKDVAAGFIALAAALVQLWGLYLRAVAIDFAVSAALAAAFVALTWKKKNVYTNVGITGFALMLVGIAFDPLDGGITKDYCNLSYLFTTGGMAVLVTAFLLMLEFRFGMKSSFIAGVGQNPMVAYTVTSFFIGPVLNLTGILPLIYSLSEGNQFWGVAQGAIITFLMMCVTYLCTKMKLFWRS